MKRTRKGFTLVELLIVIAIIALLGSMGLVSGKEANNIAEAQKIVENFHIISSAMEMYYADNNVAIAKGTGDYAAASLPATIKKGLAAYMKDTSLLDTTAAAGKYAISVSGNQWWLCYTLDAGDTKLSNILANKAVQEGFRQSAVDNDEVPDTSEGAEADATVTNIYEASGTAIYLRVR
ncbi:MAG: type II secretion system protein [Synergistaceae bacterium]|nr:type II secretion system protein [Synergistaceae bacterium]